MKFYFYDEIIMFLRSIYETFVGHKLKALHCCHVRNWQSFYNVYLLRKYISIGLPNVMRLDTITSKFSPQDG
jgi:hypothetical protein